MAVFNVNELKARLLRKVCSTYEILDQGSEILVTDYS